MLKDYLITLKNKGNFSWNDLSEMSGIPEATIRKIFSGETADPRFETIAKIVSAMGGSLDEINENGEVKETDPDSTEFLMENYEERIAEIKETSDRMIDSLKRDKKILAFVCVALLAIFAFFLIMDAFWGNHGWIRY